MTLFLAQCTDVSVAYCEPLTAATNLCSHFVEFGAELLCWGKFDEDFFLCEPFSWKSALLRVKFDTESLEKYLLKVWVEFGRISFYEEQPPHQSSKGVSKFRKIFLLMFKKTSQLLEVSRFFHSS